MKDSIVEEVRRLRDEHTHQFQGDLHLICDDLRRLETTLQARLVTPAPRRIGEESPKSLETAVE